MSRSRSGARGTRKDKSWCRGCDAAYIAQKGEGRCRVCNGRLVKYKANHSASAPDAP